MENLPTTLEQYAIERIYELEEKNKALEYHLNDAESRFESLDYRFDRLEDAAATLISALKIRAVQFSEDTVFIKSDGFIVITTTREEALKLLAPFDIIIEKAPESGDTN